MKKNKTINIFLTLIATLFCINIFTGCDNTVYVDSIALSPKNIIFEAAGDTITLRAIVSPNDADNKTVEWIATSNSTTAAVEVDSKTGFVTALDTTKLNTLYAVSCFTEDGNYRAVAPIVVGNLGLNCAKAYKGIMYTNNQKTNTDARVTIAYRKEYNDPNLVYILMKEQNLTCDICAYVSSLLKDDEYVFSLNSQCSVMIDGVETMITVSGTIDIDSNIRFTLEFEPDSPIATMSFEGVGL